jgi:phenylacetate-CoA ligase
MPDHYDSLETRAPEARESSVFECLRALLVYARDHAPAAARQLEGFTPAAITDRAALARLPVIRKSDLVALQHDVPPYGGLATRSAGTMAHGFMSPGPIFEPGGAGPNWWRMARAMHAAGVRGGDLIQNCFAYHLTPAGMMIENGARALGAGVIPAGPGQTEAQIQAAAHLRPNTYAGTPDFLKIILDKAEALGVDLSSITRGFVSGGALFPSLRAEYAERGVAVLQCYATADIGLIAYESPAQEGMIVDEGVLVEIVRPGTGDPVPHGEVGEVVVTSLNPDYPLIRFGTGDLSAVLPGISPCGRTNMRIRGWMGRADQTTKIRGMFVRPEQVAEIVKRHDTIVRARLTVTRANEQDAFTLQVETPSSDPALTEAIADTVQTVLKLRGSVSLLQPGALPNDGKVIDDQRSYT